MVLHVMSIREAIEDGPELLVVPNDIHIHDDSPDERILRDIGRRLAHIGDLYNDRLEEMLNQENQAVPNLVNTKGIMTAAMLALGVTVAVVAFSSN